MKPRTVRALLSLCLLTGIAAGLSLAATGPLRVTYYYLPG